MVKKEWKTLPLSDMNEEFQTEELEDDDLLDVPAPVKRILLDFIVEGGQEPLRIDKYLLLKIASVTRNKVQQAIDDGLVEINGKVVKQNYKIKPGDHVIAYTFREPPSTEVLPEDIPIDIVYEDNEVLIINKKPNMVVHPGVGNYTGTLVNAVYFHLQQQQQDAGELPRIGLVHRIDKDTSGLLVFGKTEKAIVHLSAQFKAHTVYRRYNAIVWGDVEAEEGTIDTFIGRNERNRKVYDTFDEDDGKGKHAITHYKVLERFNYVTLVECRLETGRTHQIRVHMKHIGHTLFNDAMYGGDRILKGTVFSKYKSFVDNCFELCPRQALHAKTLGFIHPETGEAMHFESELPDDISKVIERWRVYVKAKGLTE